MTVFFFPSGDGRPMGALILSLASDTVACPSATAFDDPEGMRLQDASDVAAIARNEKWDIFMRYVMVNCQYGS